MPFEFAAHDFPDVLVIEARTMTDDRGWFRETYRESVFREAGLTVPLRQENLALTRRRGTLRGLHFQIVPAAQSKLVSCLVGAIHDVAVDLRPASPRFGRWLALELTAANGRMVWLPAGFAHGYQTLVDDVVVAYRTDVEYSPAHERGVRWDDPTLAIDWPIADPQVSPRDQALPLFDPASGGAA